MLLQNRLNSTKVAADHTEKDIDYVLEVLKRFNYASS